MAKQGAGRPRKPLCITTVHREMQMGIAEGLKKWYEPPQEMSQELARLLACAKEQRLTSASDSPSAEAVLDRGPRATDHICIATLGTRRDGAAKCATGSDARITRRLERSESAFVADGVTSGETFMRNTLFLLSLMAGLAIASASSASAAPINAAAVKQVVTTTSPLQPARYRRYRRWGWGYTKCYREFAIGPYSCHWFPL
jgi:hypothetical protein